jgi:hypothetical protein
VYPLDGFGILLGETIAEDAVLAWAALPVGKTTRWYNSAGRFADIGQALKLAAETFASWAFYPVGVYPTVGNTLEQSATQSQ